MNELTHFDSAGNAIMVDIAHKEVTKRSATARGQVILSPVTMESIKNHGIKKGNVLNVAQLAGIMGAKHTPELIPLCHPLSLTSTKVNLSFDTGDQPIIHIEATCEVTGRTGVEMEALTAVSIAALTVYDMVKAIDKNITISNIELIHKSGGQSGEWVSPKIKI